MINTSFLLQLDHTTFQDVLFNHCGAFNDYDPTETFFKETMEVDDDVDADHNNDDICYIQTRRALCH